MENRAWLDHRAGGSYHKAAVKTTTPVGQYSPHGDSPYGCTDMAGNVLEWTVSMDGKYRVLRGGAYNHGRDLARCAFRVRQSPAIAL